jgi:hypothetical protein
MKLLHQHSTLSAALLIFVIFGVFLVTLMPFDFRFPESIQISWATSVSKNADPSAKNHNCLSQFHPKITPKYIDTP